MPDDNISKYFRDALIASNNSAIDFAKEKTYTVLSRENFHAGLLNESETNDFQKKFKKGVREADVIAVYKTIKTEYDNGEKSTELESLTGIFYIPATISFPSPKDMPCAKLSVNNKKLPWFPREFLAPMIDSKICLGRIEDVDRYLSDTTDKRVKISSWDAYIEYCNEFFEQITQTSQYHPDDFEAHVYLIEDKIIEASKSIEALYEDLIENGGQSELYQTVAEIGNLPKGRLISSDNATAMMSHCGQMGNDFPLADSQRTVIHHLNALPKENVLAVSGPPGTGKTTLLQAVVATSFVTHALRQADPPIIAAVSTNNQAVTNIIDSFSHCSSDMHSSLAKRWIEGIEGFAVYFPSTGQEKAAEEKHYQYTNTKGAGLVAQVENALKESTQQMINEANNYFGKSFSSIEAVANTLYEQLRRIDYLRCTALKQAERLANLNIADYLAKAELQLQQGYKLAADSEKKIQMCQSRIAYYRERVNEWNNEYVRLKQLLHIFPWNINSKRQQLCTRLSMFRNAEEIGFLHADMLPNDIYAVYAQKIEQWNQKEHTCAEASAEQRAEAKQISNNMQKAHTALHDVRNSFQLLKSLGCDIWEGNETAAEAAIDTCNISKLDELIDTHVRYVEFWLAVHYYECQFLMEKYESPENCEPRPKLINFYKRLAFLAPCMVMTFFKLPSNFKVYHRPNEGGENYLYNFIDLLIIDEAGQASPEVALAAFAMAQKAIVVGDEAQIPPVYGISGSVDKTLALTSGTISNVDDFDYLLASGHNCTQSSIMHVAKHASYFDTEESGGLLLTEHRRCYNEIIEYCNELVYNHKLQALRGRGEDDVQYPLQRENYPHMGYKNLFSATSLQIGTSRCNKLEAEKIARWISFHYPEIRERYLQNTDCKRSEILAIITPFKVQVGVIKKQLRAICKEYEQEISVGTVHTFQGGERRIIIFSTVYGNKDGCSFIDKNKSIINVAVSRAKDAFWVFGNYGCLSPATNAPSNLLKKYIAGHEVGTAYDNENNI